jgi:hypothetical protein
VSGAWDGIEEVRNVGRTALLFFDMQPDLVEVLYQAPEIRGAGPRADTVPRANIVGSAISKSHSLRRSR